MGISALISSVVAGIGSAATAVGSTVAGLGTAVGLPSAVTGAIGTGITSGLESGVLNAGVSAIEGKNPLKGFESGFISGGVGGAFGPWLGQATGLGASGGRILGGAAGGAAGAAATGGDPLRGAIGGGVGSYLTNGVFGGGGGSSGGGSTSALSSAMDPSLPSIDTSLNSLSSAAGGVGSGDLSAPVDSTLPGDVGAGAAAGGSNSIGGLPAGPGEVSLAGPTSTPTTPDLSGASALGGGNGGSAFSTPSVTVPGGASVANDNVAAASPFGGIGSFIQKNPLLALGAGAALLGNRQPPGYDQLAAEAARQGQLGRGMENYLATGTLPPGLQSSVTAASLAAKATLRAQYAERGMSGSSAEAQDLAGVDQRAVAESAQIATQLFNEGLNASQLSDQLYLQLMQQQMQQDQNLSGAVGNLAGAMAMMGQPLAQAA